MQYIGHTMGVPGRSLNEAAQVFAAIGCTGMEVIMREQHPFPPDITDEQAAAAAAAAVEAGVPIITITPYAWDINHVDPEIQVAHCNLLSRAINLAVITGATYIRAYGGPSGFPRGKRCFCLKVPAQTQSYRDVSSRGFKSRR